MDPINPLQSTILFNPWSQRKEIGFFKALWETSRQVLLTPAEFFNNLEVKKSLGEPFLFYFIISILSCFVQVVTNIFLPQNLSHMPSLNLAIPIYTVTLWAAIFLISGIVHVFVLLFRGQGGYFATFNAFAYSSPAMILSSLPFLGWIFAIWSMVITIIGIKRLHQYSLTQAILSYVIPFILFIGAPLLMLLYFVGQSFKGGL